ncbi:hypothetical protein MS2017_0083 [Bathymodiolus thermophilus thioautotrophic gill symbiont]|uniref:Haemolysin-type calcium binding-related domain-containing protein n=1 Tax=Bathymodiolus thermophilus thioautotrophic gill symbiont TaxID=2360 RepID=A0A3G3IJV2_9GAMM|nr:calcium-binding protein [Bathymodiolus thermophilus thioautotrophic gill symbiont]AYQ55844.1 hypothetical protein MS2017_0083 [Bathymodiolus thermophilus thioautotrophic gill symbiont]
MIEYKWNFSETFYTYDEAVKHVTELLDEAMKNDKALSQVGQKVGVVYVKGMIKINATFDSDDDVKVVAEVGRVIADVVSNLSVLKIVVASGFTLQPRVGVRLVVLETTKGGVTVKDITDNVYDYLKHQDAKEINTEVSSAFMSGFEKGLIGSLLKADISALEALLQNIQGLLGLAGNFEYNDPLAFDLDGDGIEIVPIKNGVMFDHNSDGIKTKSAWLGEDDAWLALDKNGNGAIDNGSELFGDSTILSNGNKAKNGIEALADLDSNHDGIINNEDEQFKNLRLWQDVNQDGVGQRNEIKTLEDLNIEFINLTRTGEANTFNGARQTDGLEFTKTDDFIGRVAELSLDQNEFYSEFLADVKFKNADFNVKGLGYVRDLAGAMSVDDTLKSLVTNLMSKSTYSEQSQIFDQVLYQWSKGAVQASAFNAEFIAGSKVQKYNKKLIRFDIDDTLRQKLAVLETMSAEGSFLDNNNTWFVTQETDAGKVDVYSFNKNNGVDSQTFYEQAYDALKSYQMTQVARQTLFKPWVQSLKLTFEDGEPNIDTSATKSLIAKDFLTDHDNTMALTLGFNEAYGQALSKDFNYLSILKNNSPIFKNMTQEEMAVRIDNKQILFAKDTQFINATEGYDVHWLIGLAGNDVLNGGYGDNILIGGEGNDTLNGGNGYCNTLEGGAGNDILNGEGLFNTLEGGAGNDILNGGNFYRENTYLFNLGDGQDEVTVCKDIGSDVGYRHSKIIFGAGINITDITATSLELDLVLSNENNADKITIKNWFASEGYQIEQFEYADGTIVGASFYADIHDMGVMM